MIIYHNSCSFGVLTDGDKCYPRHIADHYSAQLIDRGKSGSCNRRILRTSCRDLLSMVGQDVLVLIGLSNTFRNEIWGSVNHDEQDRDGHFKSFTAADPNSEQKDYKKQWYLTYDHESQITNLLCDVFLFTQFLQQKKFRYLIWTNANTLNPIDFNQPFVKEFFKILQEDKNILPLFDFNFCDYSLNRGYLPFDYDTKGKIGHPGHRAHQDFADYLIKNHLPAKSSL